MIYDLKFTTYIQINHISLSYRVQYLLESFNTWGPKHTVWTNVQRLLWKCIVILTARNSKRVLTDCHGIHTARRLKGLCFFKLNVPISYTSNFKRTSTYWNVKYFCADWIQYEPKSNCYGIRNNKVSFRNWWCSILYLIWLIWILTV